MRFTLVAQSLTSEQISEIPDDTLIESQELLNEKASLRCAARDERPSCNYTAGEAGGGIKPGAARVVPCSRLPQPGLPTGV